MKHFIFFYILTALGIIACNVGAKKTETLKTLDCYIRVLESEGQVLATATMTEQPVSNDLTQDKPLPVEIAGGIRYQGSPMELIPSEGLTYIKKFPGAFQEEQVFSWDEKDKTRRTFKLRMNNIPEMQFSNKVISASAPATVTWAGVPPERGEAMVFMWENAKDNLTVPMELYVQGSLSKIDFPAQKMKELTPGEWTLYVVRKKLIKEVIGDVQAQAILEFYSKTDTIQVVK